MSGALTILCVFSKESKQCLTQKGKSRRSYDKFSETRETMMPKERVSNMRKKNSESFLFLKLDVKFPVHKNGKRKFLKITIQILQCVKVKLHLVP